MAGEVDGAGALVDEDAAEVEFSAVDFVHCDLDLRLFDRLLNQSILFTIIQTRKVLLQLPTPRLNLHITRTSKHEHKVIPNLIPVE